MSKVYNKCVVILDFNGERRYLQTEPIFYSDGKPMACCDIKTTVRKHLAYDFGSTLSADDYCNDLHSKEKYMESRSISFAEPAFV